MVIPTHFSFLPNCLAFSRKHVWHILTVFKDDGFTGLEEQRTHPVTHPENQLTLPFFKGVLQAQQEHPRVGRFRVRGIMVQRTRQVPREAAVGRAMALNRKHRGAPPAWSTDRTNDDLHTGKVKFLPLTPTFRHRYWFVDFRCLVRIGEGRRCGYSRLIVEGSSRKILAGMTTEYQDVVAVPQLLNAAMVEYSRPDGMISDNGLVFTQEMYEGLLKELRIEVCHIEKSKMSWIRDVVEPCRHILK